MGEPDMEQRDPNNLNDHVKVRFDEIFGEPEAARSIDCVWRNSYKCFVNVFSCCYKTLTVICAIPLAFCWACEFACTACYHVWYLTPYIRTIEIFVVPLRKLLALCLEAFLAPCVETYALIFSKIVVKN